MPAKLNTPPEILVKLRNKKAGPNARSSHDLHRIWVNIKQRCYNPNNTNWKWYGGKGIKVCERWHEFMNFVEDMGPRPTNKHTVERKDGNGDYCPENCRWATMMEQGANKPSNHYIEYNGEKLTASEWGRRLGVSFVCILHRLYRGWSVEKTVTTPSMRK